MGLRAYRNPGSWRVLWPKKHPRIARFNVGYVVMRALSVKQPWTELIARGQKKIEYRSWQVSFRGDLLIAASASHHDTDCKRNKIDPESLVYGHGVCVVDLWKITGDEDEYKWHLRNPRRVRAIPVVGRASIYHVEDGRVVYVDGSAYVAPPPPPPPQEPLPTKRPEVPKLAFQPVVLLATSERAVASGWAKRLRKSGCQVTVVGSGDETRVFLEKQRVDAAVVGEDIGHYFRSPSKAKREKSKLLTSAVRSSEGDERYVIRVKPGPNGAALLKHLRATR